MGIPQVAGRSHQRFSRHPLPIIKPALDLHDLVPEGNQQKRDKQSLKESTGFYHSYPTAHVCSLKPPIAPIISSLGLEQCFKI
eukprot:397580-Pelagomonas_calceolata.AAC.5